MCVELVLSPNERKKIRVEMIISFLKKDTSVTKDQGMIDSEMIEIKGKFLVVNDILP